MTRIRRVCKVVGLTAVLTSLLATIGSLSVISSSEADHFSLPISTNFTAIDDTMRYLGLPAVSTVPASSGINQQHILARAEHPEIIRIRLGRKPKQTNATQTKMNAGLREPRGGSFGSFGSLGRRLDNNTRIKAKKKDIATENPAKTVSKSVGPNVRIIGPEKIKLPPNFDMKMFRINTVTDKPSRHNEATLARAAKLEAIPQDCAATHSSTSNSTLADNNNAGLDGIDVKYAAVWGKHVMPKATRSMFGVDKVYIVHYSPLTNRRDTMRDRLLNVFGNDCMDTNFVSFITALDRENITAAEKRIMTGLQDLSQLQLSPGVVSVAAKHYLAYYDALHHNYDRILILEDDVAFMHDDFGKKLSQVVCALPSEEKSWANAFIATAIPQYKCDPINQVVCLQDRGENAAIAYLMSNHGCRIMMESLPTVLPSDTKMNAVWKERGDQFLTYGVNYNLAREDRVDFLSTHNDAFVANKQ